MRCSLEGASKTQQDPWRYLGQLAWKRCGFEPIWEQRFVRTVAGRTSIQYRLRLFRGDANMLEGSAWPLKQRRIAPASDQENFGLTMDLPLGGRSGALTESARCQAMNAARNGVIRT